MPKRAVWWAAGRCSPMLSRYTHRVAISNHRMISADETGVTFQVEGLSDRRGRPLQNHVARSRPSSFRQPSSTTYCQGASTVSAITACSPAPTHCRQHRPRSRTARYAVSPNRTRDARSRTRPGPRMLPRPCPCCGGRMIIIETFAPNCPAEAPPHARSGGDPGYRHLMMTAPSIHDRSDARHSCWLSSRQRQSSQRFARFTSSHVANLVVQRAGAFVHTDKRTHASRQIHRANRYGPSSAPRLSSPNPHRARHTAAEPPTAISCLGAFPTPAASARR